MELIFSTLVLVLGIAQPSTARAPASQASPDAIFARPNLVAWCIVPYDARQRTPQQRAEMLERIGIHRFAYDWRDQHLPTFEAELAALAEHHIELTAVWLPAPLDRNDRFILDTLAKHKLHPQLWVMASIAPQANQAKTVEAAGEIIRPIARQAAKIGSIVALYNHGGWFGEPENQIAIIGRLKREGVANLGIVYNFHHGHDHLDRFPELLAMMKPYLVALNVNGMVKGGDRTARLVLPIGQGDLDLHVLTTIRESGWAGPIGILNHTDEDAEGRLLDNIEGLDWLAAQLDGAPAGPRPQPRTYRPAEKQPAEKQVDKGPATRAAAAAED
jgi:hypothetical protein